MPEEINRVVADQVSRAAVHPLARGRGEPARRGRGGGRDPLRREHDDRHARRDAAAHRGARRPERSGLERGAYLVVTLHRPTLVDGPLLATRSTRWRRSPSRSRSSSRSTRAHARRSTRSASTPARAPAPARAPSATSSSSSLVALGRRAHRLGRHPGGDDVPRHPVLHAARQHRAAGDGRAGHERPARAGPERIAEVPALLEARRGAASVPPLWDGHAAERIVALSLAHDLVEQRRGAAGDHGGGRRARAAPRARAGGRHRGEPLQRTLDRARVGEPGRQARRRRAAKQRLGRPPSVIASTGLPSARYS